MSKLNPLIPIFQSTFENEEVNSLSAKKLHETLNLKKDFSDWIKNQIERADLSLNVDFMVYHIKGENPKGGRPQQDYILTLDAAKHIAMMSQSKKAKEVRNYFIEVEKKYIASLKQQALTSKTTVSLSVSLTDELFKRNEQLLACGIISSKLTSNEIRILSALIRLQEKSTKEYLVQTNRKIGNEVGLIEKSVAIGICKLEDAKAVIKTFKRNEEGRQERRLFVSTSFYQNWALKQAKT